MQLLRSCAELQRWRSQRRQQSERLHLVPTMGALHTGHQSLIRRATAPAAQVLVSVFVNPLQFGPGEDFARYPRTLEQDAELAAAAGATALFAPSVEDLYPHGDTELTRVVPPDSLQQVLCGRHRPGHFNGVATVVLRLLGLIRPDQLLLGEKDWQQLVILRRVIADLGVPVAVQGCGTQREADGLALSSRNRYLSAEQRQQAAALPRSLLAAQANARAGQPLEPVCAGVRADLEAAGLVVDYVEAVEPHSLRPCSHLHGLTLLAAAAHCGPSRLIDHQLLPVLLPQQQLIGADQPKQAQHHRGHTVEMARAVAAAEHLLQRVGWLQAGQLRVPLRVEILLAGGE